jgi:hypothetical protein
MRLLFVTTFFLFLLGISSHAEARSWREMIEEAEARSDFLFEEASKRGYGAERLGTAYNEIGADHHTCAILGRLLDRKAFVIELERFEVTEPRNKMSESDIVDMLVSARMLENWASIARYLLDLSKDDQIAIWNLDCVDKFGIPITAGIKESRPESKFRSDGNVLFVLGNIESGFAETFAEVIASNPEIDTVALGSAGGSVYDALKAGQMIRALRLDTTLANNCYSACPLVFLGGVNRTIWSPYSVLGFHQMYTLNGGALSPTAPEYEVIMEYVQAMGANEKFVVAAMFAASPDEMFKPELQVLCDNKVATWVQRLCP